MISFDTRTVFLIVSLLYVLLPTVTLIVLARQRTKQVMLWCGGGLLVAVSAMLVSTQDVANEWGPSALINLTTLLSHLLRVQALRIDLGRPWRWRSMALAALALSLVLGGIHWGLQNALMRSQFMSAGNAFFLLYIAILARRVGLAEQSRSAHWIAGVYGLVALAFVARFAEVTIMGNNNAFATQMNTSSTVLGVSLLLSAVVGHFGYVGLALDRATRREILSAKEQARNEENQRLGVQIAQLDRQRSLGEMSASLGHELNQPLTAILSNAQVAKRGLAKGRFDQAQLIDFLDKIIANTQRASQIVERIRDFIRPAVLRREPVDLLKVTSQVAELAADFAHSRKVVVTIPTPKQSVWVVADGIQISQIILNVLRNSIQALQQVPQRNIRVCLSLVDDRAVLAIHDSGPGFAPNILAQIGTPFFTTKPGGLGMGLSISRSIAEQHGGTLTFGNAKDGGALVTLNLPAMP